MAGKTEEINIKVKSDIGEVSQDAKGLVSEFKVMGVSLDSLKKGFATMTGIAKKSFATIKAGIASTGIGLLVIALGSLTAFFTKTKKGAEILEVAFAGIGAAVSVIVDRVAKFGGAIVKLFKGDVKGALKDVKGAFTGIGTEIAKDVTQAIALKNAFQALRDSERELNVETAQRRADIEALKLIAEDVTKSEKERLDAAKAAFKIENDLLDDRIANAEEAVRIQKEQNRINESMDEDLDALAQREIELANIRGESITKQIELNNKINAIESEVAAKRDARHQKRLDDIEKEKKAVLDKIAAEKKASDDLYNAQIAQADTWLEKVEAEALAEKQLRENIAQEMYSNLASMLSSNLEAQGNKIDAEYNREIKLAEANGKDTEAIEKKYEGKRAALAQKQKKLKIGLATVDMYQSVVAAYNQGMGVPPPAGLVLGPLSAGLALAAGLANINSIMQTDVGGGGGGGGAIGGAEPQTPAPEMMSGAFTLSGGVKPEPVRAYVVTDEMTNSQNQLANIRRRATI